MQQSYQEPPQPEAKAEPEPPAIYCDGCNELIVNLQVKEIFWKKYSFCCDWCLIDFEYDLRKSYRRSIAKSQPKIAASEPSEPIDQNEPSITKDNLPEKI